MQIENKIISSTTFRILNSNLISNKYSISIAFHRCSRKQSLSASYCNWSCKNTKKVNWRKYCTSVGWWWYQESGKWSDCGFEKGYSNENSIRIWIDRCVARWSLACKIRYVCESRSIQLVRVCAFSLTFIQKWIQYSSIYYYVFKALARSASWMKWKCAMSILNRDVRHVQARSECIDRMYLLTCSCHVLRTSHAMPGPCPIVLMLTCLSICGIRIMWRKNPKCSIRFYYILSVCRLGALSFRISFVMSSVVCMCCI